MSCREALLAAALCVCGSHVAALPVRVGLEWPASAPGRARVQAVRTAGPIQGGAPVEAEAGPDGAVLDLGEGVWHVDATAPGYWSEGAEVAVDGQAPPSVRVALWPAASLHGEVRTAERVPLPRELQVRMSAVPAAAGKKDASPPRAELRCPIVDGAWRCLGPAGLFDARLEATGYAPRYVWDARLDASATVDLGRTDLRRAASVFGRAVLRDGSSPRDSCHATVRPDVASSAPQPDPARANEGVSAPLSRRGYFHVVGVPPGAHLVAVECEAASAVRELRVSADREARIDPPLVLEDLTLDVVVTPKVDPEGRPWQLTVDATAPRFERIADQAIASPDGRWVRRGLTAGTYRVAVQGAGGRLWLQRFFELGPESGPLSLRVGVAGLAGRVLLGSQPLRAQLVFLNEGGGEPATLTSDDEGRFQGTLPVAPDVTESRWTVEVHAEQPPIRRRVEGIAVESPAGGASAWLELALPAVAVRGTVVSEQGKPQAGAQVTFEDAGDAVVTVATTDNGGGFEVFELPAGAYTAAAESSDGVSERTPLEVVEGLETELRLVVRSERFGFYVVGSGGPLADATVQVWIPPGVPRGLKRTDAEGRFEADLPPGTTEVGLTIGAPGHALKLTRLTVANEQTITLGTAGGTLVLDLASAARAGDGSLTPYLVHDGAIEAAGALSGWGNRDGSGGGPQVATIEPGVYALCLANPDEVAALWRGSLPSDRCRSGSAEPGQTLTLSPP